MKLQIEAARATAPAGRSLASLGIKFTREMMAVQPSTLNPQLSTNLSGWIVPQAQTRWLAAGVAWYTPQRCEMVFRQALAGDLQSQWEMFDLMEATWPELLTCLGQLKDAVVAQGIRVVPFCRKGQKPSEVAVERAGFVQECLDTMRARVDRDEDDFEDAVRDLLDARGKGISILEVDYESRELSGGSAIAPRCLRWVHPLWYGYPHGPGSGELMLRPGVGDGNDPKKTWFPGDTSIGYGYAWGATPDWQEFPPDKFVIGICKSRTGHPLATAMLHSLTFWWAAFNFTAEWFFVFAQINGQPFRWATYDPNMSPNDQAKLQAVLANMGANAWGMFPEGTTFELKEIAKAAGDNPNIALLEMANKFCRLLILRQTLTSDVGGSGSRALGEVHERVLGGVEEGLGKWACKTLQQLVRSICRLNYGDETECPVLVLGMDEEASPEELGALLVAVNQAGLEATDEAIPEIGERLGFAVQRRAAAPVLGLGTGVLGPEGKSEIRNPKSETNPNDEKEAKKDAEVESARDGHGHWIWASAGGREAKSPTDAIVEQKTQVLAGAYRGSMAPFRQIILRSASRSECERALAEAYADWKPERLAHELESALQICAATGAAQLKADGV